MNVKHRAARQSRAATSVNHRPMTSGEKNAGSADSHPHQTAPMRIMSMNITLPFRIVAAATFALAVAPLQAQEKSVSQTTSEVWDKTKETTKDVSRAVAKTTRETVNRVEAAVREPDADARKVDVKVNDKGLQMPNSLKAGKTAFVVTNTGKAAHDFEIEGSGLEKSFWFALATNQTKTMQVDLKPGTYEAACGVAAHAGKEQKVRLTVK